MRFPRATPSTPPSSSSSKRFLVDSLGLILGIVIGILIFLFLWLCAIKLLRKNRNRTTTGDRRTTTATTIFSPMIKCAEKLSFLDELEDSGLEVIGQGGCGKVYKAKLGTKVIVAIKKIVQPSMNTVQLLQHRSSVLNVGMKQIRSEIMTMGRVRHPNLLRLLAHVSRPNNHYLVYEYMPNGSLQDALNRSDPLTWPMRYDIAMGIAAGLEYLHFVHKPCIIHRDLKPANILLDGDFTPRIADFGLAKLVSNNFGAVGTKVAGTLGYIAPEYYKHLSCTTKCDVYSFGVILAVLVTGKFPGDQFFRDTEEVGIMTWVRKLVSSGAAAEVVDRRMVGYGFEEQMMLVLKIACFCTYDDPKDRPTSRDVRCMLSQIKH